MGWGITSRRRRGRGRHAPVRAARRRALLLLRRCGLAAVVALTSAALLLPVPLPRFGDASSPTADPAPTADPTGSAGPATPTGPSPSAAPAVDAAVGFSLGELVGTPAAQADELLDRAQALGARAIRLDVSWETVDPRDARHEDWHVIDRAVAAVRAHGLSLVLVIGYTPAWARPPGCSDSACAPRDPAQFADFVGDAVARYSGDDVLAWEVWNEPNTLSWAPSPDPAAYAVLLRLAAQAAHEADPAAVVLVGGLAPAETSTDAVSPVDFLTQLYDAGAAGTFDGVAVHPYCFPALPGEDEPWSGWTQMVGVRAVMVDHGDDALGVWATEFGAPTSGAAAQATVADRRVDEHPDHGDAAFQSATVTAAFDQLARLPWLRSLLWYSAVDLGGGQDTANSGSFGLVAADGTPKPAAAVWRAATAGLLGR